MPDLMHAFVLLISLMITILSKIYKYYDIFF